MNLNKFFKENKTILIICFLVFVATASYAFYFKIRPAVDAWTYDTVAMNIINGHGFRLYPERPLLQDDVINYQGPLYQYFLAGIYLIFGHHYEAVWIIQAFLRAISVLFLFSICRKLFGEWGKRAGWIAAVFLGFYPDLIEISAMLLTETLFIFFLIVILYIFIRYYEMVNFKGVFLLGFSTGIAILIRSTAVFFLPVFLFYFWRRRAYKQMILFLTLILLIMTPWTIRNYLVYHRFIPTMVNIGNLWVGNHEGSDADNKLELVELTKRYGVLGINDYCVQQFKKFIKAHPLTYIKLIAIRAIEYFSFIRPMGFWFYQKGWGQLIFVLSSALASVFLFTFGFAGFFSILKKERQNIPLIYLIILAFLTCASVIPIIVVTRYRFPIYPFMAIFAGFFIARLLAVRKEYLKYLIVSFSILSFFSLINIALEYNKIIEKFGKIFYG